MARRQCGTGGEHRVDRRGRPARVAPAAARACRDAAARQRACGVGPTSGVAGLRHAWHRGSW
eukprot:scaffold139325_cov190-Phaeocystis_antarctica.AAC.1